MHSEKQIYPEKSDIYHCGDVSGEVPPVLIPNTEVKLTSAENTLLETAREDRLLLHPFERHSSKDECFFFLFVTIIYSVPIRKPKFSFLARFMCIAV